MRRRDFLSPKILARTAAGVLEVARELAPLRRESTDDALLLRFARQAMATTFEIILPFGTRSAQIVADAALNEIDRLESQLTVYRDDSEISRLNSRAALTSVVVDEQLFQLLAMAQQLSRETEGAFDVCVGALIKAWGFYRRQGSVPSETDRAAALAKCGMTHLTLDPVRRTVAFSKPGLEINLGSIGKGFALDQTVRALHRQWQVHDLLIHGGHSSVFALGNEPGSKNGWSVGLLDPDAPKKRLGTLRLQNRGLGVSAATYQHFVHEGRKLGHILDPRTGWPAEGMRLAAATAPTAAEADALATAFFILGADKAWSYCEEHPQIGAVLLSKDLRVPLTVLGTARAELDA